MSSQHRSGALRSLSIPQAVSLLVLPMQGVPDTYPCYSQCASSIMGKCLGLFAVPSSCSRGSQRNPSPPEASAETAGQASRNVSLCCHCWMGRTGFCYPPWVVWHKVLGHCTSQPSSAPSKVGLPESRVKGRMLPVTALGKAMKPKMQRCWEALPTPSCEATSWLHPTPQPSHIYSSCPFCVPGCCPRSGRSLLL